MTLVVLGFYFIGLIIGVFVGYIIGVHGKYLIRKQKGGNNCVQIQTDEVLIDADYNREIAKMASNNLDSKKAKLLAELTRRINRAASDERTRLYVRDDYDLNQQIRKYLTINEIKEYFNKGKYKVEFRFVSCGYSDIEYIDWSD